MQRTGLIRIIAGLFLLLGGVGGVEQSMTDLELAAATGIAFLGLALMAWAARDINRRTNSILENLKY